ncbi:MAG: Serine/threonine-protein kinase PknB [candidate division BRC1 bacterium ADurb.BinA364]|nr:MAG: Serine/threonine-protein kinase PknB [candidate division BRC1 bacterium ADurb.BinA364]
METTRIGRFELLELLGQGAMGQVHRARDTQLHREVAIKVIRLPGELPPARLAEIKAAFRREARLAANMAHRGIVQVYDVGEQDNHPYIVLELLQGLRLSKILSDRGALSQEYASRVFLELLSAMAYAHRQGIVHLDLKPSNIMILKDGAPRIMDFGIARTFADLRRTDREMHGTPRYMAPEQIMARKLDPRCDVFALGVIFYEMLSGRTPFAQETFSELREAIAAKPHPPLQSYQPGLPPAYYDFIDRALEKKPENRFSSANAMLERFEAILDGDSGKANLTPFDDKNEARCEVFNFIKERIQRKGDFPAVARNVQDVVEAARQRGGSAQTIAECILRDFALTSRVLRMVNSAYYQSVSGSITTISRAVVVLGTESIINLASALDIFEHFLKHSNIEPLKRQAIEAMFCAMNARGIANALRMDNSEEAFICGMLNRLGQLIVAFYFPEEHKAIDELIRLENLTPDQASRRVMRLSYLELAQSMAGNWGLPPLLLEGLTGLPAGSPSAGHGKIDRLKTVVACASELSQAVVETSETERDAAIAELSRRYEDKIAIGFKDLRQIVENSIEQAWRLSKAMRVDLRTLGMAPASLENEAEKADTLPAGSREEHAQDTEPARAEPAAEELLSSFDSVEVDSQPTAIEIEETIDDPFVPFEARPGFVGQALGEIAATLAGPFLLNDVMMMSLEAMYRGLAFRNVVFAMVTPKRERIDFRYGLGPKSERLRRAFQLPLTLEQGMAPARCILQKREIAMLELADEKLDQMLPREMLEILAPRSLLLIPVVVLDSCIGLFMATRSADQPAATYEDLQSLRMLAGCAALAIRQSTQNQSLKRERRRHP